MPADWDAIEPDLDSVLQRFPRPLAALADMEAGAIVLRRVFAPESCAAVLGRFLDRGLMYHPKAEVIEERFLQTSVQESGWHRIADRTFSMLGGSDAASRRRRIDIGTSLGNLGNSPDQFFAHAQVTHNLFATLFEGIDNPIDVLYSWLSRLADAEGHRVLTAREPDGRLYGPAIFRIHYGGFTYGPHFDSVRLREKRTSYAVHRFQNQFAGVMCLQNAELDGATAQGIIHRCRWSPEVEASIVEHRFREYVVEHQIPAVRVELEPGDLYFFNTQLIHEVPGIAGDQPRVVLATFIGYSADDPEVFVWS
jgi:hypothetical protein